MIVVGTVAVVFLVRVVVLGIVADYVGESETVVGGDEIDRCPGTPAVRVEDVAGPGDAGGEVAYLSVVALPESPNRVPIAIVPFGPAGGKAAELITCRIASRKPQW